MTQITKRGFYKTVNEGMPLATLLLISWIGAAVGFKYIEGETGLNSLYWAMTTMSTVGYGDISATTAAGKIFTIAFQAWSVFMLIPCVISHVVEKVRVDLDKDTDEEQDWRRDALIEIAAASNVSLRPYPENDH